MRTVPPPSTVTVPPPSMTVSVVVGSSIVCVTVMVAGAEPQAKVTTPPLVNAADSSAGVHEAEVPVPTTVVGLLTSAAAIGAVQMALGGGTEPPSTFGGGDEPPSGLPGGVPPASAPGGAP